MSVRPIVRDCVVGLALILAAGVRARADDAAAARGAGIYARACATCHGASGDGKGASARYLDPSPRDFTRGVFKFRSTPSGRAPTIDDLARTIRVGVPRTTMPAWETMLSEREIDDVAHFVTTFAPETFARDAEPITIPDPPEMTAETIAEGKSLYIMLSCWTCHGTRGRGDGKAAGSLTDDWGNEIEPFDFTSGRFKSGDEDRDIYRTIYTGLNGTPMPAYGDAVLVGGVSDRMLARYRETYGDEAIDALEAYVATQPSREELRALDEASRRAIAERRVWSIVHYVRALRRDRGLLHDIFVRDHEVMQ